MSLAVSLAVSLGWTWVDPVGDAGAMASGHDSHDEHDHSGHGHDDHGHGGHDDHGSGGDAWVLVPLLVGLVIGIVLAVILGTASGGPALG